jgi:hypothetical protein
MPWARQTRVCVRRLATRRVVTKCQAARLRCPFTAAIKLEPHPFGELPCPLPIRLSWRRGHGIAGQKTIDKTMTSSEASTAVPNGAIVPHLLGRCAAGLGKGWGPLKAARAASYQAHNVMS